jgi:actin-related protein 10
MSLFETFANKPSVIIDIGHAYTKCGFSGEAGPFAIIPTEVTKYSSSSTPSPSSDKCKSLRVLEYRSLVEPLTTPTTQLKSDQLLREMLVEFLYTIYYKVLNANSRERKVVIVESVMTSSEFRRALADVLFNNFQAVSVAFIESHVAALYTLGISKGLVIDCGYSDCQIMPIAENIPLAGLAGFVNCGARAIHRNIEAMLRRHAHVTVKGQRMRCIDVESLTFSEDILEDIKLRCCFVTPLERARQYYAELESKSLPIDTFAGLDFKFAPDCDYNLPKNYILHVPGFVREMALDFVFVDKVDGDQTVPHLILDTILRSPIDLRRDLTENVVLLGGTCMLLGFKARLASEINWLLSNEGAYVKSFHFKKFKYHVPPSHDNYTAWLGGAIFGALDNLDYYSILNAKYKEVGKLPDWFTLYPRQDKAHQI